MTMGAAHSDEGDSMFLAHAPARIVVPRADGFRDIPTVVDGVLRGQLARLKAFVETGRPD